MAKWECMVCGYIYDPEEGDADADIPAGTAFESRVFDSCIVKKPSEALKRLIFFVKFLFL